MFEALRSEHGLYVHTTLHAMATREPRIVVLLFALAFVFAVFLIVF